MKPALRVAVWAPAGTPLAGQLVDDLEAWLCRRGLPTVVVDAAEPSCNTSDTAQEEEAAVALLVSLDGSPDGLRRAAASADRGLLLLPRDGPSRGSLCRVGAALSNVLHEKVGTPPALRAWLAGYVLLPRVPSSAGAGAGRRSGTRRGRTPSGR